MDKFREVKRYLKDIRPYSVLSAEEEYVITKDIKNLELSLWTLLLSHTETCDMLLPTIERFYSIQPTEKQINLIEQIKDNIKNIEILSHSLYMLDTRRNVVQHIKAKISKNLHDNDTKKLEEVTTQLQYKKQQFIKHNLRLVISIARRTKLKDLAFADAIQEGNISLMQAVDGFDPDKGYKFNTFASELIENHICRAVHAYSQQIGIKIYKSTKHGKYSTGIMRTAVPAHTSTPNTNGEELINTIPTKKANAYNILCKKQVRLEIERALNKLQDRERQVLHYRYLDPHEYTLMETGNIIGVKDRRTQQIEKAALLKMRNYINQEYQQYEYHN